MLMDTSAVILIVGPLLYNVAMKYGVDPVHLGCIMVFNLAIGQATPPFGSCLFAGTTVTDQSVLSLSKSAVPFVAIEYAVVLLITFVPSTVMWLVNMMH